MPVQVESAISGPFVPNGVTTVFPFTFKADSASEVIVADQDGEALSDALFSVTLNSGEGGEVTFSTAPSAVDYELIYIVSDPALTQLSDFGNTGPSFNPASLTRALDRAAIRDLRQQADIDRSLKVPFGQTAPVFAGSTQGQYLYHDGEAIVGAPAPAAATSEEIFTVSSRAVLAGITGTAGQSITLSEAGREAVFVWDGSDLSAEVAADPNQYEFVPPSADTTGASGAWVWKTGASALSSAVAAPAGLRTILLDAQVSRMLAGAGDGDTDPVARAAETAKFQAMADTGRSFSVPDPAVSYAVDTITLANGQTIEGAGQFRDDNSYQFVGNGVDPVFQVGDGTLSGPRRCTLRDLSVYNSGAGCIVVDNAPNFIMERVRARSESLASGATVALEQSFRNAIRDSDITASGGATAIDALLNMNGFTIENVTCSGGVLGRAIRVGTAQGLRIVSNIIESSLDGIWVASTSTTGDGNCNGVLIAANYLEQCKTPLVLAKHFAIFGLECVSNFISNSATSIVSAREAAIQFGRIKGGLIADNSILTDSAEDAFWIWLQNASGDFDNLTVERNYRGGDTPANVYQFKGTYAANASVKGAVGAVCNFGFMGSGNPLGSSEPREWISPPIDASVSTGTRIWLSDDLINMGGKVLSAEICDVSTGAVLTNVALTVGRTNSASETVSNTNLGALTLTNGRAALTLGLANIYDGQNCIYSVTTAGGASGTFRLRLRYRAN